MGIIGGTVPNRGDVWIDDDKREREMSMFMTERIYVKHCAVCF